MPHTTALRCVLLGLTRTARWSKLPPCAVPLVACRLRTEKCGRTLAEGRVAGVGPAGQVPFPYGLGSADCACARILSHEDGVFRAGALPSRTVVFERDGTLSVVEVAWAQTYQNRARVPAQRCTSEAVRTVGLPDVAASIWARECRMLP